MNEKGPNAPEETPEELAGRSWQGELLNLPPPVRDRLTRIMTEHAESILNDDRVSLRRERRGDGRPYWRLYLESGSGEERERRRVYVGPEGGPELRAAIIRFRRACWDGCDGPMQFIRAAKEYVAWDRKCRRAGVDKVGL